MTPPILIDHLPSVLANFPDISLVYLFGSQVTGQVGPMSDYDLAIVDASRQDDLVLQAEFTHAISKLLDTDRVDVVLLNRAPIELAYHIIVSGIMLYQKDLYTRVEFEANVLGKYGDYLPTLRFFSQHIPEGDAHGKRAERYREVLSGTLRKLKKDAS